MNQLTAEVSAWWHRLCQPVQWLAQPNRWLRQALRGWGWFHTSMGLLLGTLALFNMGALLLYSGSFNAPRAWVYNVLQFGLPGVLALRMADSAVAGTGNDPGAGGTGGFRRWLAYGTSVLGVIVTGVWVTGPLLFPLLGGEANWGARQDVMLALNLALPFSVGTVAYAHWRQGTSRLQRLQAAELARAFDERLLQSARLLALQARVEPQLLFDTLGRVRDACVTPNAINDDIGCSMPTGANTAEQLLGDLCSLLRALQGPSGATASTLGRELALVQAYARVAGTPALLPPRLLLQPLLQPAGATRARLAPLLLLPVLRALVGSAPTSPWLLHTSHAGQRLCITISPTQPSAATHLALQTLDTATLHQRARAVHGQDAAVRVHSGAHTSALVIDLPLVFDEHDPTAALDPYSPDR